MIRRSTNRISQLWRSDGSIADDDGGIRAEVLHFSMDQWTMMLSEDYPIPDVQLVACISMQENVILTS